MMERKGIRGNNHKKEWAGIPGGKYNWCLNMTEKDEKEEAVIGQL